MASYEDSVFINCPFDRAYRPIFNALVFVVHECGYFARSALEIEDSGQVRIQKIQELILDCRLGIHDISRTEPEPETKLPRFNMPLELGLFLGANRSATPASKPSLAKFSIPSVSDTKSFVPISLDRTFPRTAAILNESLRWCGIGCELTDPLYPFPAAQD